MMQKCVSLHSPIEGQAHPGERHGRRSCKNRNRVLMIETNKQGHIKFGWASPGELEDICQVQQNFRTGWPHPKVFFQESLEYGRVLLATEGKTPIAYLVYELIWGNTAFLSLVKVLPEYQRRGIGTAMLNLLEERLVSLGFSTYVTSSETVNQHTKQLLPNLGFTQIGKLQMHHGEEIFYLKKLS